MFGLDIETLGTESNSVILSIGIVYVDNPEPKSYQQVVDKSIFVKLSAKEQIESFGRKVDKNTVDWWNKQGDVQKKTNFIPSKTDFSVAEAIRVCREWVQRMDPEGKALVWTRGSMDSMCLDSLFRVAGEKELFMYNRYRDVRTAVDLLYPNTSKNGYCDIDPSRCFGYEREQVLKHHPVHDSAMDLCMLLYGVTE
jgi:hypothetical protein